MTLDNCWKPRIAYVMTPITFGGGERVSLSFLKNVDRDKFIIEPIMFLRPWEPKKYFEIRLSELGFECHSIPVAKSKQNDYLRVARCFYMLLKLISINPTILSIPTDIRQMYSDS